jgi:hypothetical protein
MFGRSISNGATWTSVGNLPDDVVSLIWDPSNELIGTPSSANQGAMKPWTAALTGR